MIWGNSRRYLRPCGVVMARPGPHAPRGQRGNESDLHGAGEGRRGQVRASRALFLELRAGGLGFLVSGFKVFGFRV